MQILGLVGLGENFKYNFPDEEVTYPQWIEYLARDAFRDHSIRLGFRRENVFGADRVRVVVWIDNNPSAEFTGADDFTISGDVISVLRVASEDGPGERNVRYPDEPVPERYQLFNPSEFRSRIDADRAPYAWCVASNIADHRRLAIFAALRNFERVT